MSSSIPVQTKAATATIGKKQQQSKQKKATATSNNQPAGGKGTTTTGGDIAATINWQGQKQLSSVARTKLVAITAQ